MVNNFICVLHKFVRTIQDENIKAHARNLGIVYKLKAQEGKLVPLGSTHLPHFSKSIESYSKCFYENYHEGTIQSNSSYRQLRYGFTVCLVIFNICKFEFCVSCSNINIHVTLFVYMNVV